MSSIQFFDPDFCQRLVIALMHSLWQGVVIGGVVLAASAALRNRSAQSRYVAYVSGLMLLAVCVPITFALVKPISPLPAERVTSVSRSLGSVEAEAEDVAPIVSPDAAASQSAVIDAQEIELSVAVDSRMPLAKVGQSDKNALAGGALEHKVSAGPNEPPWGLQITPWLTGAYLLGVLMMMLRIVLSLCGAQRLRKQSVPVEESRILTALARQSRALGLKLAPPAAFCRRVAVPTVVGILRPVVLLPVSFATTLSTDEVEVLLAHELAHIRRWDPWVNLLQRFIEAVLFFNPTVWILTRCISTERENCCDDLVVKLGAEPTRYAESLLRLVEMRSGLSAVPTATLLQATGGRSKLSRRIERLLDIPQSTRMSATLDRRGVCVFAAFAGTLLIVPLFTSGLQPEEAYAVAAGLVTADETNSSADHNSAKAPLRGAESQSSPNAEVVQRGSEPRHELTLEIGLPDANDEAPAGMRFLDLETGNLIAAPDEVMSDRRLGYRDRLQQWARDQGIDLQIQRATARGEMQWVVRDGKKEAVSKPGNIDGIEIQGIDFGFVRVADDFWQRTEQEVAAAFPAQRMPAGLWLDKATELPATYAFETPDKRAGLLQILSFSVDSPSKIRFRFTLHSTGGYDAVWAFSRPVEFDVANTSTETSTQPRPSQSADNVVLATQGYLRIRDAEPKDLRFVIGEIARSNGWGRITNEEGGSYDVQTKHDMTRATSAFRDRNSNEIRIQWVFESGQDMIVLISADKSMIESVSNMIGINVLRRLRGLPLLLESATENSAINGKASASHLFSDVVEVVLPASNGFSEFYQPTLDFESGRVLDVSPGQHSEDGTIVKYAVQELDRTGQVVSDLGLWDLEKTDQWRQAADVVAPIDSQLSGYECVFHRLPTSSWDTIEPAEVTSVMESRVHRPNGADIVPKDDPQPTLYAFQTRQGTLGIATLEKARDPSGVLIRYRLVQSEEPGETDSSRKITLDTVRPFVNLVTGETFVPPSGIAIESPVVIVNDAVDQPNALQQWAARNGVSLGLMERDGKRWLQFFGLPAYPIGDRQEAARMWETMTGDEIRERYRRGGFAILPHEAYFTIEFGKEDLPQTWLLVNYGLLRVEPLADSDQLEVTLRVKSLNRSAQPE